MDPFYVQAASLAPVGSKHDILFTNLSSQQMYPGELASFFTAQDAARQPMPFTDGEIPTDRSELGIFLEESTNCVSCLKTPSPNPWSLNALFAEGSNEVHYYRTPYQRMYNVPANLLEARADELF